MELRSCYFCGATGRTVDPTSVGDATVVLCPTCEDKLDRLHRATGTDVGTAAAPVTFDDDADEATAVTEPDERSTDDGSGPTRAGAKPETTAKPDEADGADTGGGAGDESGPQDQDPPVTDVDEQDETGAETERSSDDTDTADGTDGSATGETGTVDHDHADANAGRQGSTDATGDGPSANSEDATARSETPHEQQSTTGLRGLGRDERGGGSSHRQALRLLGNREFPIERAAAVDLLSSAYDLDREECERLVDLTVDRGLLIEDDGQLRRA